MMGIPLRKLFLLSCKWFFKSNETASGLSTCTPHIVLLNCLLTRYRTMKPLKVQADIALKYHQERFWHHDIDFWLMIFIFDLDILPLTSNSSLYVCQFGCQSGNSLRSEICRTLKTHVGCVHARRNKNQYNVFLRYLKKHYISLRC